MDTRYAPVAPCFHLAERDVIAALLSRDECAALLAKITSSKRPLDMLRQLLPFLARLATPACTWLDGELAVELFAEEDGTKIRVMSEIGAGMRERVLPVFTVNATLDQIESAIALRRDVLAVLQMQRVSARCLLLLASEEELGTTDVAGLDISETSLSLRIGSAPAVDEVDSGWDN